MRNFQRSHRHSTPPTLPFLLRLRQHTTSTWGSSNVTNNAPSFNTHFNLIRRRLFIASRSPNHHRVSQPASQPVDKSHTLFHYPVDVVVLRNPECSCGIRIILCDSQSVNTPSSISTASRHHRPPPTHANRTDLEGFALLAAKKILRFVINPGDSGNKFEVRK